MDCIPDTTAFVYPDSPTGTLLNVITRGYVIVGSRRNFSSAGYGTYSDPPYGALPEVEQEAYRR